MQSLTPIHISGASYMCMCIYKYGGVSFVGVPESCLMPGALLVPGRPRSGKRRSQAHLYRILLDRAWGGNPHTRILFRSRVGAQPLRLSVSMKTCVFLVHCVNAKCLPDDTWTKSLVLRSKLRLCKDKMN